MTETGPKDKAKKEKVSKGNKGQGLSAPGTSSEESPSNAFLDMIKAAEVHVSAGSATDLSNYADTKMTEMNLAAALQFTGFAPQKTASALKSAGWTIAHIDAALQIAVCRGTKINKIKDKMSESGKKILITLMGMGLVEDKTKHITLSKICATFPFRMAIMFLKLRDSINVVGSDSAYFFMFNQFPAVCPDDIWLKYQANYFDWVAAAQRVYETGKNYVKPAITAKTMVEIQRNNYALRKDTAMATVVKDLLIAAQRTLEAKIEAKAVS